ncbi:MULTISPECIES: GtrA family protein [unclassified Desulfovibrio]|uniref:GtrA family protein n=1 Tax=unclassified Desulfovibrio TaxID=2593640 RepID=UPI0013EBDC50|nr:MULTISPECIES: GtrA family protein [unclassified Desulfovibrio]
MPLPPLHAPTFDDLRALVRRLLARRWMRFCIVGGTASLVYYFSGLFFVSLLGLPVLAGNALAFLAGFVVSYLGQALWTFQAQASHRTMLPRFAATQGVGLVLNSALIWVFMRAGLGYPVAMWAAIAAVPVAVYFICKLWVFRP